MSDQLTDFAYESARHRSSPLYFEYDQAVDGGEDTVFVKVKFTFTCTITELYPNIIDGLVESWWGGEVDDLRISVVDASYYGDNGEWYRLDSGQIQAIRDACK